MESVRLTCATRTGTSPGHRHITQVGDGSRKWSVPTEAYAAIDSGTSFYTYSPSASKVALVRKYHCPNCNVHTLISAADAVTDNNLDNLGSC